MSEDCALSPAKRDLLACLDDIGEPFTLREALDHLRDRHEEFIDRHRSARHRPWMHTALNDLVSAGKISRQEGGGRVRYSVERACV